MTLSIRELLEHSYVLTVDRRRLELFNKTFSKRGLTPLPRPYFGRIVDRNSSEWRLNRHFVAAHMSHFEICDKAMKDEWPFVCIFEEDAVPCVDVQRLLAEHLVDIPDDAFILKLGYVRFDGQTMRIPSKGNFERISEKKFSEVAFGGSHAYVIFKGFFEANSKMLQCYRQYLSEMKDVVPIHSPKALSANAIKWWFYEWMMTPKVYKDTSQNRIYHVDTRCNLFVQPDYVSWDDDALRWFGKEFAPSRLRCFLRFVAGKWPFAYKAWRVVMDILGHYRGGV